MVDYTVEQGKPADAPQPDPAVARSCTHRKAPGRPRSGAARHAQTADLGRIVAGVEVPTVPRILSGSLEQ